MLSKHFVTGLRLKQMTVFNCSRSSRCLSNEDDDPRDKNKDPISSLTLS